MSYAYSSRHAHITHIVKEVKNDVKSALSTTDSNNNLVTGTQDVKWIN